MHSLSIIIPCLNEEHYIGLLLGSLVEQTFQDFEVIVVDGKSDDKTIAVIEQYRDRLPSLSIVVSPRRNIAFQRNLGETHAKYDQLLFLDADTQLGPDFLHNTLSEIERRNLKCATTNYKPLSSRTEDAFLCMLGNMYLEILQHVQPVGMGWGIFSNKKTHADIHGFSEDAIYTEDFDYFVRAAKSGAKIRVLRSDIIYISVRRLEKEGRLNYAKRAVISEIYRIFNGKIIKEPMPYEFGIFNENPQQSLKTKRSRTSLQKYLRQWQREE